MIPLASHTRSEGRGEQILLSHVYQSAAEYIEESSQYRAKNQQATTKGEKKKGGRI